MIIFSKFIQQELYIVFNNFIFFKQFLDDFLVHAYGGQKYALTWFLVLTLSALPEVECHGTIIEILVTNYYKC